MAVVVEKRPEGVVLGNCVTATVNQDYSTSYATVNKSSHGLVDGDYVYIKSDVENYNGFWGVDVINPNQFLLRDSPYVAWVVDAQIIYCPQILTHAWSCVHLPIVYTVSNTRWPVNTVDQVRTISSISDDNGYTNLNLSGSLGSFEDLAFIKISNAPDSDFDGVYQILDKIATNDVTINLSFSAVTASGIVGASVQLYYNSYVVNVRIYAGINSAHYWSDIKPYELADTMQLIPDSNNIVKFSVNEVLKRFVETSNNLLQPSLPNNIDFWTQFYISIEESYDISDGYTIQTFSGGFTDDIFSDGGNFKIWEGYAANSMLPFKNIYSGYLTEYLMLRNTGKFLTLFSIPVLFSCSDDLPECYQDISFILPRGYPSVVLRQQFYSGDMPGTTINTAIDNSVNGGLYRVPISPDCSYDMVQVNVVSNSVPIDITFSNAEQESTADVDWTESGVFLTPTVTLTSGQNSEEIGFDYPFYKGRIYNFSTIIARASAGGSGDATVLIKLYKIFSTTFQNQVGSYSFLWSTASNSFSITPTADADYITVQIDRAAGGGSYEFTITSLVITGDTISETKEFDIECGCSNQEIRLCWLNNLGGFDYWTFTAESEYGIDVTETGELKPNIFPEWPSSYGEFATDKDRIQTFRKTAKRQFLNSQFLTRDQVDAISYLKSSPIVQIINSRKDRRTVIVDSDSFTKYADGDKTFSISFNILFDDLPGQVV